MNETERGVKFHFIEFFPARSAPLCKSESAVDYGTVNRKKVTCADCMAMLGPTKTDYLRVRIRDALQGRKTALKLGCAISYRQATNRARKARQALRRHNSKQTTRS